LSFRTDPDVYFRGGEQLPLFYGTHLEQRLLKNSQEKQKDPSIRSKNPIANRSILRRCPENT